MENLKIKRKRSENWCSSDKSLLQELCAENIRIIESKNIDTNTNKMKRDRWVHIMNLFNKASTVMRDISQLQFQWRGMKCRAKQAESSYRKKRNATGGGPPPTPPGQEVSKIIELIPNEFQIDSNEFDSDVQWQQGNAEKFASLEESIFLEEEILVEQNKENDVNKNNTEIILVEQNKEQNKENDINKNNTSIASNSKGKKRKAENIVKSNAKEDCQKELFELTKKHMIEEHEKRMEILSLEKLCRQRELEKIELQINQTNRN